jgi:NADH:ubiquinone oxidoreductase subunit 3 (subunit A)
MNSLLIIFIFIPILALILLTLNLLLSPNKPDSEKLLTYECGFSPILGQTRNTFHISFFLIALAFLILDLEILLFFPISVSLSQIGTFGLAIALIFFVLLTIGYIIEILAGNLKVSNQSLSLRKNT